MHKRLFKSSFHGRVSIGDDLNLWVESFENLSALDKRVYYQDRSNTSLKSVYPQFMINLWKLSNALTFRDDISSIVLVFAVKDTAKANA